jgi:hypothetical protein
MYSGNLIIGSLFKLQSGLVKMEHAFQSNDIDYFGHILVCCETNEVAALLLDPFEYAYQQCYRA